MSAHLPPLRRIAALLALLAAAGTATAQATAVERKDLHFRLSQPGPGWRVLDTEAIKKVQPRAVAGAVSADGVYGVVVVEPAPEGPLLEVGRALVESTQLEDKQIDLFEGLELRGRSAVHWMLRGTANDVRYRHHITLVKAGDNLYRLVSWARTDGPSPDAAFREFVAAFSFLDGAREPVSAAALVPDARGAGWRLRRGIWQSPATGLEVVPRGGWRVVAGAELWNLNTRATVGLFHEGANATVLVFADRVTAPEQEAWKRAARAEADELGEPLNESTLVAVDGVETELRMFTTRSTGDDVGPVRELSGQFLHGETCADVLAWYPLADEGEALTTLHAGFDSIHFLDDAERAAIRRELAETFVDANEVGDGFSLRQGVYRDFRFGLRWRRPDPRWEAFVGESADLDQPGAALALRAPELGARGALRVHPTSLEPHAVWHEAAVTAVSRGRTAVRIGGTTTLRLGDVDALVSVTEPTGVRPTRVHVLTAESGGWAFELRLSGSPGVFERERSSVEAALAAFGIAASPSAPSSTTARAHYDDRLGFQLRSPEGEWTFTDTGAERFWPLGTLASWTAGERRVAVLALCGASAEDDVDFHASLARNSLPVGLAGVFEDVPAVAETTFADRAARELVWSSPERTVTGWVFARDRTLFVVLSVEPSPTLGRGDVEALFELLP